MTVWHRHTTSPIVRVGGDEGGLCLRALVPEPADALAAGLEVLPGHQVQGVPHQGHHLPGQGKGGSEPRGLDADEVNKPRLVLPNHEVPVAPLSRGACLGRRPA